MRKKKLLIFLSLLINPLQINENGKYNRSEVKRQINNYTDNENEAQMILEAVDKCFKGTILMYFLENSQNITQWLLYGVKPTKNTNAVSGTSS